MYTVVKTMIHIIAPWLTRRSLVSPSGFRGRRGSLRVAESVHHWPTVGPRLGGTGLFLGPPLRQNGRRQSRPYRAPEQTLPRHPQVGPRRRSIPSVGAAPRSQGEVWRNKLAPGAVHEKSRLGITAGAGSKTAWVATGGGAGVTRGSAPRAKPPRSAASEHRPRRPPAARTSGCES
jgi:hypothetical protein